MRYLSRETHPFASARDRPSARSAWSDGWLLTLFFAHRATYLVDLERCAGRSTERPIESDVGVDQERPPSCRPYLVERRLDPFDPRHQRLPVVEPRNERPELHLEREEVRPRGQCGRKRWRRRRVGSTWKRLGTRDASLIPRLDRAPCRVARLGTRQAGWSLRARRGILTLQVFVASRRLSGCPEARITAQSVDADEFDGIEARGSLDASVD